MAGGVFVTPHSKKPKPNIAANDRAKVKREREALPIWNVRGQLKMALRDNNTAIVIGETGCGKSTQLPQMCVQEGGTLLVAVTQPRRVAAITIAHRVAHEMDTQIGNTVGYSVRFENTTSDNTLLVYMTDGMLLREALHDPLLKRYSVVIIDEAHERTLHTDIMFGVVKRAQMRRAQANSTMLPSLKVVVMSATMDVDAFSAYFNNAPVFFIEGRTYPVQVMYASRMLKSQAQDYVFNALVTVFQLHKTEPISHDILVFLTGQEEIDSAVKRTREIAKNMPQKILAIPLYASLGHQAQMRAFLPVKQQNTRKVIYATNIAETSLTIPGIRLVVDSGKVKLRVYQPKSRIDLLRVASVSQAQACQRTGRAGREAPGKCFRLYSEKDMDNFAVESQPEIERCSVSSVVLELLRMGVSDVMSFDFMKAPSEEAYQAAIRELRLLGAIEDAGDGDEEESNDRPHFALTEAGTAMVAFPIEPKLAKVLLSAAEFGCLEEALIVVAAMSQETVFVTTTAKKEESALARRKFEMPEGDHAMLLKVYRAYAHTKKHDAKAVKQWCQENFVLERHMESIWKVRQQLRATCVQLKLPIGSCSNNLDPLRRALCAGLFMNACEYDPGADTYKLMDSSLSAKIHPSSCLSRSKPAAVVFTDLVMTAQLYARDVTVVDPAWVRNILHEKKAHLRL